MANCVNTEDRGMEFPNMNLSEDIRQVCASISGCTSGMQKKHICKKIPF